MEREKFEKLNEMLRFVSPGTEIRKGLDNILLANKGVLIVIGDTEDVTRMIDGGFYINCDYTPEKVYELAKMDGAIILSYDMKKILYANVHMQPDSSFKTQESGTRHRTADRIAKQTGKLVIAISERKKVITLYKGELRYSLRNIPDVMIEANQAIKTLERYKSVLDKNLKNLSIMEFDDLATLYEVCMVIQRFEMLFRIADEVKKYIFELGVEGRLINMQLEEVLIGNLEELENLIRDYMTDNGKEIEDILEYFDKLSQEELLELECIVEGLGYEKSYSVLDNKVVPRGFRTLGKILKLSKKDIEKLVESFDGLSEIMDADLEELYEIKGLSKIKARSIQTGLSRLKVTTMLEK